MANETALLELVNVIGEAQDRGEWDQNFWAHAGKCSTTFCAAGWKCVIDGQEIEWFSNGFSDELKNGQIIEDYAVRALELTSTQADKLFHGTYDNNYETFVAIAKGIISGEIK